MKNNNSIFIAYYVFACVVVLSVIIAIAIYHASLWLMLILIVLQISPTETTNKD
jgi:hypothetical protein